MRRIEAQEAARKAAEEILAQAEREKEIAEKEEAFIKEAIPEETALLEKTMEVPEFLQSIPIEHSGETGLEFAAALPAEVAFDTQPLRGGKKKKQRLELDKELFKKARKIGKGSRRKKIDSEEDYEGFY